MEITLEALRQQLFSKDGGSSVLLLSSASEVAEAWSRCEDGGVMQYIAVVAGERYNAVRAAMACARGASVYERAYCGPYPEINAALDEVEAWLDDPRVDRHASLIKHEDEVRRWVKWTAGSCSAHAIADVVQLTHAVVTGQLRWAPALAAGAVNNSADAMVEDALRFEGAPEGPAVEARLRARALAYLTQVVRELLPCPPLDARALRERWLAGWSY